MHVLEQTYYMPRLTAVEADQDMVDYNSLSLSDAVQKLWNLDSNRLKPNADYAINVQKGKKPYWKEDTASEPLFQYVESSVWSDRPTYRTFRNLLDNYTAKTGVTEQLTDAENSEIENFLSAIMETAPLQFCHEYCHRRANVSVPSEKTEFRNLLRNIWFDLYSRSHGSSPDSSGFEHVFVGEVKNGEVSGFHNWIQFYLEEQAGNLDYRGYIKPKGETESEADADDHILTFQFAWRGVEKFVGTSFVGVSPEFEMALYTVRFRNANIKRVIYEFISHFSFFCPFAYCCYLQLCYLIGDEENQVKLNTGTDTFNIVIKCYKYNGEHVGTSFPEVSSHYEN
jgi:poly(U)-specific endoribonuclease